MDIATIILAGGQSSRMGKDKALIKIGDLTLLNKIYQQAQQLTPEVYVITSWPEKYQSILPNTCNYIKEVTIAGPLVAFAQALKQVNTEWILLLACDLPNFDIKELKLLSQNLSNLNSEYIACLPRNPKGWEPLCGFYRHNCISSVENFINRGGKSFQTWLKLYPVAELPLTRQEILFNCNTPEDLEYFDFQPQLTKDGSFTFFSSDFQECFHSHYGAKQEAIYKFVIPCQLPKLAKTNNSLKLLDICYGLGYNSAAALEEIWQINPQCHIELIGLELNPLVPLQASQQGLLNQWKAPIPELLAQLATEKYLKTPLLSAHLFIGDARLTIQEVAQSAFKADAVFLDPFSPPKCPQLWTIEFLNLVAKCIKSQGILATYSCAGAVRIALQSTGMKIGTTKAVGRRAPGTVASFAYSELPPLSLAELEYLQTRAAIPYRDYQLTDSAETIWQRRLEEQENSNLEFTSRWKKRWSFNLTNK